MLHGVSFTEWVRITPPEGELVAIDMPLDAYEQQYMQDEPTLPNKRAKFAAENGFKLVFPDGGLALDIWHGSLGLHANLA